MVLLTGHGMIDGGDDMQQTATGWNRGQELFSVRWSYALPAELLGRPHIQFLRLAILFCLGLNF